MQVGGAHFFAEEVPDAKETEQAMPGHGEVPASAPAHAKHATIPISATYTVSASGSLRLDWDIDATRALPAQLAPNLFKYARHAVAPWLCVGSR